MTQHFGKISEDLVVNYLIKQKFVILERNYKKFYGEIDIIARQKNIVAFVEVKSRKKENSLLHSLVNTHKQTKIGKVARLFISSLDHPDDNLIYRFDVALVLGEQGNQKIEYIANAYTIDQY